MKEVLVKTTIRKQCKLMLFIAISVAIMFNANSLLAKTQHITLEPASDVSFSGETIAVKILYNVLEGKKKTSGIGLRIHFNSKFIDAMTLTDVYGEGMIGQHYTPQTDVENLDGDANTDKFIIVAWASITRNWPVFLDMPGQLAVLSVKIKADAPNAETKINVTSSSNAANYDFESQSARLLIQ
ncbi:MAG: hypothetical protein OMM_00777 [Candidatus Magnetoglobus multicellularis str. Araruama]|uniref:Cohesin domain-containing protein n=1 Tax=Candidatus Magnetoglobus multicellularis str. Araruama TaxID=890399 RepID=A0A1V1PFZ1_9BACT|nr:MAG: hypothetical protein OMM_00777 [Candidatus Magnetoglobus multicellularis str. Araruama]